MQKVKAAPVVLFEGILALYDAEIREMLDLKVFVHTDDDVRLGRRGNFSNSQLFFSKCCVIYMNEDEL